MNTGTPLFIADIIFAPDLSDREAMIGWLTRHHPKISREKFEELQTPVLKRLIELELPSVGNIGSQN